MKRIRVAVIGAGHWGPNLIRNFLFDPRSEVVAVCDRDAKRREALAAAYPGVRIVEDAAPLVRDPELDALVIATPAVAHFALAYDALKAGKHLLVEKPLCLSYRESQELVQAAEKAERILMTGHVFLYNLAVRELKRIVNTPTFGNPFYIHARRTNLGPVRQDVHAGWDLATHDVSIVMYLKGMMPTHVTASGQEFLKKGIADVVFATLYFADRTIAHIHASWLDPNKVRQITAVGSSQMATFDDMNLSEPIRIHNRSLRLHTPADKIVDSFADFRVETVRGDMVVPDISTGEPLKLECQEFLEAVQSGRSPISDGRFGADVVRVMEAVDQSMANESRCVALKSL